MANKPLKSIKYPGLSDTYTFVQIGTEAGQAADAKVVGDEINYANNGYEVIKGTFVHGSVNATTGVMTESANNYKYRVVTPSYIQYDRDITIRCTTGYQFQAYWYDDTDTLVSKMALFGKSYTIKKNTRFRLYVLLDPNDTSANVDPAIFQNNIYVESYVGRNILDLNIETNELEKKISFANMGKEMIKTDFVHGSVNTSTGVMTESASSYKYRVVQLNAISYDHDVLITCSAGYQFQAYWYDAQDAYVSRMASNAKSYLMPKNTRFRLYINLDPIDTSANVDPSVFKQNIFISSIVRNDILALKENPLTTLPEYIKNTLAYKPLGALSKGYILLSCDDGTAGLATYTIPMLISKGVPATFGLIKNSEVLSDENYLATVLDAIANHGCCVAQHGSASWSTYSEKALNDYFDETAAVFTTVGISEVYGAICPGVSGYEDTSALIQAVAGGRFGSVFSGNRADKIAYGSFKSNGARSNMYDLDRKSAIGFADASAYQAAIDEAYDNHYILCPFWHDYSVVDDAGKQAIIEGMIDYAKTKGLTFITMADLPTII